MSHKKCAPKFAKHKSREVVTLVIAAECFASHWSRLIWYHGLFITMKKLVDWRVRKQYNLANASHGGGGGKGGRGREGWGPGFVLLAVPAFLPSVISCCFGFCFFFFLFFFFTKNKEGTDFTVRTK